jgi:hypothetical protein
MKTRILITLTSLIILSSCQENEEISPYAKMEGRWEQIFDVNGLYEGYHTFEFNEDGTYVGEFVARTLDTKELKKKGTRLDSLFFVKKTIKRLFCV